MDTKKAAEAATTKDTAKLLKFDDLIKEISEKDGLCFPVKFQSDPAKDFAEEAEEMSERKIPKDEWGFVSAANLLSREIARIPTLYDPIFPRVGLAVLAGESDAGKSMLLRQMAICVATGRPFLGMDFGGRHRSALYVSSEDGEDSTEAILPKNNVYFCDDERDWENLRFLFEEEDIRKKIDGRLARHPADLVIIDAMGNFFEGKDLNSSAQVQQFYKPYKALAEKHKCLIVFLHHVGKGREGNTPTKNALVGSQSIEAGVRVVLLLVKEKTDPNIRHLCIVKHNYLPSDYKRESIVLRFDSETYTFKVTGGHVPFDLLGEESGGKRKKCVCDFGSDRDYIKYFGEILKGKKLSRTKLMREVKKNFGCSQDYAYMIIDSYNGVCLKETTKGRSQYYTFIPNT